MEELKMINLKKKNEPVYRWKIQTAAPWGQWADLKDSETLKPALYTKEEAAQELRELGGRRAGYIVVREDFEETFDLYE
jgi:hypothetical protein